MPKTIRQLGLQKSIIAAQCRLRAKRIKYRGYLVTAEDLKIFAQKGDKVITFKAEPLHVFGLTKEEAKKKWWNTWNRYCREAYGRGVTLNVKA